MTIKDLFFKPLDRSINGVVKADQSDDATVWQELEEYVVTNELEKHFRDFFESYSTDLKDPSIPAGEGFLRFACAERACLRRFSRWTG